MSKTVVPRPFLLLAVSSVVSACAAPQLGPLSLPSANGAEEATSVVAMVPAPTASAAEPPRSALAPVPSSEAPWRARTTVGSTPPLGPQAGDPLVSTLPSSGAFDMFALDMPKRTSAPPALAAPAVTTAKAPPPVKPPAPPEPDSLVVKGRLPPEVIRRTVHLNFGRFRACYEDGLRRRGPALRGHVATKFVIDASGVVTGAANLRSELHDAETEACITHAFAAIEFPSPGEGAVVNVVYPLALGAPP